MKGKNKKIARDAAYYDELRRGVWKDNAEFGPSVRARYRVLINLLKKYRMTGQLNDVGCGTGSFLNLVREKFLDERFQLAGSDFSQEAVLIARKNNPDLMLNVVDLRDELRSELINSSDIVICSEVLEHVDRDEEAIMNMYKMVRKGGYLLISVPYLMKSWTQHDDFSGHVRRYEPKEMEDKLMKAGFIICESFSWGKIVYELYYRVLQNNKPEKVMGNKKNVLKILFSKVLYQLFKLEDLFIRFRGGRRLFLVAKKA